MKRIIMIIVILLFASTVFAAKLYYPVIVGETIIYIGKTISAVGNYLVTGGGDNIVTGDGDKIILSP